MISTSDIAFFRSNGYLVVENLLDSATLDSVQAEYAALMDRLYEDWYTEGLVNKAPGSMGFWDKLDIAFRGGFDWYQPFDISLPHENITDDTPMHFGPAVFDMVTHQNILDTVEKLIGPEITSNPIQHVRIKPPEAAVDSTEVRAHIVATDWHQDLGVTLPEADDTEFITVWLAITDATLENGCLQVADGAYERILPHCTQKTSQVGIPDGILDQSHATPTPVKAGGAVIFHPLTPHASLRNNSDGYRWSFDLRYNVTGQPTGRSHFPEFVARSRSNPDTVLTDWKIWKQMWLDTRHRLANQAHIAQHGRWDDATNAYCA